MIKGEKAKLNEKKNVLNSTKTKVDLSVSQNNINVFL